MSLLLESAKPKKVLVKSFRVDLNDYPKVFIGSYEMSMNLFCNMAKSVIVGFDDFDTDDFKVMYFSTSIIFQDRYNSKTFFEISMFDFYEMVKFVLSNTDLCMPSDPRLELFNWVRQQDAKTKVRGFRSDAYGWAFFNIISKSSPVAGYVKNSYRLAIPSFEYTDAKR